MYACACVQKLFFVTFHDHIYSLVVYACICISMYVHAMAYMESQRFSIGSLIKISGARIKLRQSCKVIRTFMCSAFSQHLPSDF